MAPAKKDSEKEKEAKLTPEQSAALILDYLRKQNRPYSATDISSNLKNRVTKAAAAKLLKDMHERNDIEGRAAGKQVVYHAIQVCITINDPTPLVYSSDPNTLPQEEADDTSMDRLQTMETETTRLRDATTALKAEEKELRLVLREGASQVPLPELKASVTALEQQKSGLTARLAKLASGNVKPVSLEEREKVNSEHRKWQKTASARKKIRLDLWKEIEGALDKEKAAETKEDLGLEF